LRIRFTVLAWLVVATALVVLDSAAQDTEPEQQYKSPWRTPWSYDGTTGAAHWSNLDPEYAPCNTGREQSPIDIQHTRKSQLPTLRFEYRSAPLKYVINNGHTIRVNYHDTPEMGNFLIVGGGRYQLKPFHFHRLSEEYVHGKPYAMVVHLMHEASDGGSPASPFSRRRAWRIPPFSGCGNTCHRPRASRRSPESNLIPRAFCLPNWGITHTWDH
jgi:carbonic anhydrase